MKLSFSRGQLITAADAQASAALSFVWGESGPVASDPSLEGRLLADSVYAFRDERFGQLILSKTPWWAELHQPVDVRGVWLSFQGFSGDVWHDGIFGRWEDGQWVDLIMPGPAFTWQLSRSQLPIEDVKGFWNGEKYAAQKQSLIRAVRQFYSSFAMNDFVLRTNGSDVDFLLHMLLLRLAFPKAHIAIEPKDVGWKRLAQNLNITPLRSPSPSATQSFECIALGPKAPVLELLHWQQRQSPFIPLNLLALVSA